MCGICGFYGKGDKKLLKNMCDVIKHRGPDEHGTYLDENIGLGNTRLAIIDLKTGRQPIHNEDESMWITYNGELYNFLELRKELEKRGHRFYTNSDTEVIIHAYEEWGPNCLEKFNGMFAFAIWDKNKKQLFLARDRAGIKPLHYTFLENNTFLFGSEIKSILQDENVKREVDLQAFHYFLNLRYVPRELTMFKRIRRLLPGHYMIVNGDGVKIKKYWELKIHPINKPETYFVKMLKKLIEESVKRHMIADVPVGVYLSGGTDSSTLVAFARKVNEEPLKTFCMGFDNPTDEVGDARMVAEYFGTDHKELTISSSLLKEFPIMIWFADEPKRNLYPYYLSKLASQHVKTALSGLGGDEIFAGYIFKYDFASRIDKIRKGLRIQKKLGIRNAANQLLRFQTILGDLVDDEHLDYLDMVKNIEDNTALYLITQTLDKVFGKVYLTKIYGDKISIENLKPIRMVYQPYFSNGLNFIDQVFLADFSVKMIDDFLLVDDRMCMANSIETRVPFLDNELVNFSFQIPANLKLKDPNGKYILKKAMRNILPERVIKKEKQGFASDTYSTYRRELREIAMQKLPEGNLVKEGFIKGDYINKILRTKPNPRLSLHYTVIWNLLAFEVWYEIYIRREELKKPNKNINSFT